MMENKISPWYFVLGVVGALILIAGLIYGYFNDIRATNRSFEIDASTQYQACQDNLSTTMVAYQDKFGVLNFTLKGLDKFVQDAVSGRYDSKGADGQPSGNIDANIFVKAVAEAYPDTQGIAEIAKELSTWIGSRREDFSQCQQKLLSIFNAWDKWRTADMIREYFSSGYPDEMLVAKTGEQTLTGDLAREKMLQLVLVNDAVKAYDTGIMPTMTIPTPIP